MPNLTLGAPIVKCLRKHTKMFLDCHLMVTDPAFWVDDYAKAGADQITFHIESDVGMSCQCTSIERYPLLKYLCYSIAIHYIDTPTQTMIENPTDLIEKIKSKNMKAGIAIKPKTSIDQIMSLVPLVDLVLVMTVEPGFGGQKCMLECLEKVLLYHRYTGHIH